MRQSIQENVTEHQHYWQKHCGDKRPHATQEAAFLAAEEQSQRFGKEIEEYFCFNCGSWHTGTARLEFSQPSATSQLR